MVTSKSTAKPKATESKSAAEKSTPAAKASVLEGSTSLLLSLATNTAPPSSTLVAGKVGSVEAAAEATPTAYPKLAKRVALGENGIALGF
jgi:hypothetical protein